MTVSIIVGGIFGDEGKGKITAYLAFKDKIDINARGGVGPNAGHTVLLKQNKFKLRIIPSGFVNPKTRLLIGAGVLLNTEILLNEIQKTESEKRLGIDYQCGIIENQHIEQDRNNLYLKNKIGTTGTGCGPAQSDRVNRKLGLAKNKTEIEKFLTDVSLEINDAADENKEILIEGSQGTFLSLYHGTYPHVTSKDVTASAICSDIGIGPKRIDEVIPVMKAYITRVGGGPLKNELSIEETQDRGWLEKGTVTGRVRRSAPFDYELAKKSVRLNGATQIALTKLDIIYPEDKGKTEWDKLSDKSKRFIQDIESECGVPITLIGTGEEVSDTIDRR